MTSGVSASNSAAYVRLGSASPALQRVSIRRLPPTAQPNCCKPWGERQEPGLSFRIVCGEGHQHPDAPDPLALLPSCGERPRRCRAAEQRDEIATLHYCCRTATSPVHANVSSWHFALAATA
jgi:hypothetical protein